MYIFTHIHEVFHTTNLFCFYPVLFVSMDQFYFYGKQCFFIIKTIYTTITHPLISQYCKVAVLDLITQSAIVILKDIFFVIYEQFQTPH